MRVLVAQASCLCHDCAGPFVAPPSPAASFVNKLGPSSGALGWRCRAGATLRALHDNLM